MKLASDNPAITLPATATFPEGEIGGRIIGVTVRPVSRNTTVHLSATLGDQTLTFSHRNRFGQ